MFRGGLAPAPPLLVRGFSLTPVTAGRMKCTRRYQPLTRFDHGEKREACDTRRPFRRENCSNRSGHASALTYPAALCYPYKSRGQVPTAECSSKPQRIEVILETLHREHHSRRRGGSTRGRRGRLRRRRPVQNRPGRPRGGHERFDTATNSGARKIHVLFRNCPREIVST